ncbi:MAG: TonB-dependent receptor [Sphingobacteriales bacterium]|nr:TonB-dependent receptor [Sphingobacteriales bacterium]
MMVICFIKVNANENISSSVTGIVKTSDGKPAEFVDIYIKELKRGTITDDKGTFHIRNVREGVYSISAAFVGLQKQEQSITIAKGEVLTVNFTLQESSQKLNEVVVTARRTKNEVPVNVGKAGIKPMDLPQSVSIIDNDVIVNQQASKLSDVVKNVNGVSLGTTRGSTAETFFARGYNLGTNNIMKNGARSNSAAIPEASTLEKVEVLKGSAALLYGNVTSGAVINMVTKQPKFEYGGEVSMRTGSYNFLKPTIDLYGPISKKVAFRIIGTTEDAKSFRSNVKSDRLYINPSLLYKISEKTDLLVQGDYMTNNMTPDFGIGTLGDTKIPTTISRSSSFNTPWAYNNVKQNTASATLNHKLNKNWKFNFIGSYQFFDRNYFSTERIQADADGDWGRKLTRSKVSEDYYTGQLNFTGHVKTGKISHILLIGTDADRYLNKTNTFNVSTTAVYDSINVLNPSKFTLRTDEPENSILSRTETPTYRLGYYVQDLISLSSKFKVLAGLRYTYQKIAVAKIYDATTGFRVDNTTTSAVSKYDKAFSPRVGLVYQPVKNTSFYASYSNNFVPNSGINVVTGQNMGASVIDQYEIGVKNDIFNSNLSVNLSIYRIINSNFAKTAAFKADGADNSDTNLKEFAGETTSDGAEIDINGRIVQGLSFMAGYSYNFMRFTNSTGAKYSYVEGERLVTNPANTANASLFYTLNNTFLKGVKLGASGYYFGKRNGGWNNQVGQTQTYNRLIPISAFTTLDVSAGYTFRKLSVLGKISNLTNELNYYVHENYSVNPIAPRQFVTTLSYKF